MDFLLPPRRMLGPLTLCLGALTVCTLAIQSWTAGLLAVLFVFASFAWSMSWAFEPATDVPGGCAGCAAGCVRCRERIDAGS